MTEKSRENISIFKLFNLNSQNKTNLTHVNQKVKKIPRKHEIDITPFYKCEKNGTITMLNTN